VRKGNSRLPRMLSALLSEPTSSSAGQGDEKEGEKGSHTESVPQSPLPLRPLRIVWAATLTGAVAAELAATSAGPVADFVRALLRSAGVYVEMRGPRGSSNYSAVCECRGELDPVAPVEGSPGDGAPANQRVPPPAVGP
jgi:hypothetical protein